MKVQNSVLTLMAKMGTTDDIIQEKGQRKQIRPNFPHQNK